MVLMMRSIHPWKIIFLLGIALEENDFPWVLSKPLYLPHNHAINVYNAHHLLFPAFFSYKISGFQTDPIDTSVCQNT